MLGAGNIPLCINLLLFIVISNGYLLRGKGLKFLQYQTLIKRSLDHTNKYSLLLQSCPSDDNSLNNNNLTPNNNINNIALPSNLDLLNFGLPTLGIWLLQPILSLIDTSVVGISKSSTVAELAALGPGIAWIDSTSYLFFFLGIATTNLYANSLSEGDEEKSNKVISHSLFTSILFGFGLLLIQLILSKNAITSLSGTAIESIPYGILYAKIRSIAAPFSLPTIVGQAAFLAAKDSITPLRAVIVGALVNLIGDILLVTVCNMGLKGAAIATTLSQISGALYLLFVVINNIKKKHKSKWFEVLKSKIYIPNYSEMKQFISFCGPIFIVLLIKSFLWTYTTFACSSAGMIDLAAHQINLNFFLFFCIFGDVISQISQTYLPYFLSHKDNSVLVNDNINKIKEEKDEIENNNKIKTIVNKVYKLGAIVGIFNSLVCILIDKFAHKYFTKSLMISSKMKEGSLLLALAALPHSLMMGSEGILIALRDSKYHLKTYIASGITFIIYQTIIKNMKLGLKGVWTGMVIFQWVRLIVFSNRSQQILKKLKYNENVF